jgi:hypothetical protein
MQRPCRVLFAVLGTGVLMCTSAGCLQSPQETVPRSHSSTAAPSPSPTASAPASPTPAAGPAFTEAQAKGALLRKGDLGRTWAGSQGAATWRDGVLKGKADPAECQELVDALYAEDLLGEPSGARAVVAFDDDEYGSQVRYQVGAYKQDEVDAKIGHLAELTGKCRKFTVTTVRDKTYDIKVRAVDLPGIGDARQALRLTVGRGYDGDGAALTLDVAALRVGDGAALLTHGGLYGLNTDITQKAVQHAAQRLQDVLAGRTGEKTDRTAKATERAEAAASEEPSTADRFVEEETDQGDGEEGTGDTEGNGGATGTGTGSASGSRRNGAAPTGH